LCPTRQSRGRRRVNKPAQHRLSHDLLVEVFDSKTEIPRPKRLRQSLRLRVGNPRRTNFVPVDGRPAPPRHDPRTRPAMTEMSLAQSLQLPSRNATHSSRTMRDDCIQNTRHLRQHVIPRSKTGQTTCHLSGQITCSRQDTQYR